MDYENVLLVKNEVFVYHIPPRQSNRGYRASDWRLDTPLWTGRLRVIAKGNELTINLEDRNTGELYARCPVDEFPGIAVEPVLDSSRYFVIRLMDDNGRTMFTGIGFAERSDSFDLNVAVQDHFKWLKQESEANEALKKSINEPALDLGFKQGQRIKLNLNTRRTGDETNQKPSKSSVRLGSSLSGGLLPPPPPPAPSRSRGGNRKSVDGTQNVSQDSLISPPSAEPNKQSIQLKTDQPKTEPTSNLDLLADFLGSG